MQILVTFFSKYGNTKQVAETIATTLEAQGKVQLVSLEQFDLAMLENIDLVIMGSPTHRMNLPETLRPILSELPRGSLRHISFAAFDTSYKMSWWLARFTAARKLSRILRQLGGRQVLSPESFHVMEKHGPLYEGELPRARGWALMIGERLLPPTPAISSSQGD